MADEPTLDLSLLPKDLQHLAPLIARFAGCDGADRSGLLSSSLSTDDLRDLRTAAGPQWVAINAFLDANNPPQPGPMRDLVLALDGFLQAAVDAARRD